MAKGHKRNATRFDFGALMDIVFDITNESPDKLAQCLKVDPVTLTRWRKGNSKPKGQVDLENIRDFIAESSKSNVKQKAICNEIESLAQKTFLKENLKKLMTDNKEFKEWISAALEICIMPEAGKYEPTKNKHEETMRIKKAISSEVFACLVSVNQRLEHLEEGMFFDDEFTQKLQGIRKSVAPAIEQIAQESFNRFVILQQITSLRQIFNTLPLRLEMDQTILSLLIEVGMDPQPTRSFYDQLTELNRKYEDFFDWMMRTSSHLSNEDNLFLNHRQAVEMNIDLIRIVSKLVYMKGLMVFKGLGRMPSEISSLGLSRCVQNPEAADVKMIIQASNTLLDEYENLLIKKTGLVENFKSLRDKGLEKYADLNNRLIISQDDPWNVVVGKAISLRQFGRLDDAKEAFSLYGDMFGQSDLGARRYSEIAQKFSAQMDSLDMGGGAYIYQLEVEGMGEKNGFQVGDIIIKYNEHVINNIPDYVRVDEDCLENEIKKIVYLRIEADGGFIRKTAEIFGAKMGIWVMPI